ncbi:MAG: DUF3047 domain-containing protein [Geminicoccales bacterium]
MMLSRTRRLLWGIAITLTLGYQDTAEAGVDEALVDQGWTEMLFDNRAANDFTINGADGIGIASKGSVSLLRMPLEVDIETTPTLHWRWCLTEAAPATPLSIKGADDRSLAVYIAFPFVAEEATPVERIRRKIVEAILGKDAPGRVLMYVWGGELARETVVESPHLGESGMMKILRPASTPSHQWFRERIDIAKDYRAVFGSLPPNPLYIGVSADTDDTSSSSKGVITDLEFLGANRVL